MRLLNPSIRNIWIFGHFVTNRFINRSLSVLPLPPSQFSISCHSPLLFEMVRVALTNVFTTCRFHIFYCSPLLALVSLPLQHPASVPIPSLKYLPFIQMCPSAVPCSSSTSSVLPSSSNINPSRALILSSSSCVSFSGSISSNSAGLCSTACSSASVGL